MKRQSWLSADLNLLKAFRVLVEEGSVMAAARRLHLSESAMSRTLSRVRETFDDPVLVRAGRALTPTPRAMALQARVQAMLDEAQAIMAPVALPDLRHSERTFTVRCNEGFATEFGAVLLAIVAGQAPHVRMRFVAPAEKDAKALREDKADVEIGVLGRSGPEIRLQTLLRDRFVGVVALDHPLAAHAAVSSEAYASYAHISVSRRGMAEGPIDRSLRRKGLSRTVAAVVSSFPVALAMARAGSFIANVPWQQTKLGRIGLHTFELPVETDPVVVSMMWHPKVEHDAAHRWLRECIRQACAE